MRRIIFDFCCLPEYIFFPEPGINNDAPGLSYSLIFLLSPSNPAWLDLNMKIVL
jgi:hypothetical protein